MNDIGGENTPLQPRENCPIISANWITVACSHVLEARTGAVVNERANTAYCEHASELEAEEVCTPMGWNHLLRRTRSNRTFNDQTDVYTKLRPGR
ncbi:hypothetical protein T265_01726 [Opisthorchis viverrini]|uniref:Uncharacterized protein n=1 Tax=Opisthorchis viverrini TaxID=6198 RepID=A0A075AIR7_OPIVI|nr:hypothetical protein T265_01726 [Opisthorchis viverrini]KER32104.1 hypothetical protein T265_01726 [Opisthorchis viverrini]